MKLYVVTLRIKATNEYTGTDILNRDLKILRVLILILIIFLISLLLLLKKIRSISDAPPGKLTSDQIKYGIPDLTTDSINKMESRIHAFYRLLGLPVVAGSNSYNPGLVLYLQLPIPRTT